MSAHDQENWFVNEYECYSCGHEWRDEWDACPDDDCPQCAARHVSPHTSTWMCEVDDDCTPHIVQSEPAGPPGHVRTQVRPDAG
jgi:hypothetical protein